MYLYSDSGIVGMVYTANGTSSTYYFDRNIKGDVIGIYDASGAKIVNYSYDAWGNCTITNSRPCGVYIGSFDSFCYIFSFGDYQNAKTRKESERMYFSKVWERSADYLVGVDRNNYNDLWYYKNYVLW